MRMSGSCRLPGSNPRACDRHGGVRVVAERGGFTLLELLIVLALIAFMSAMVAPRLQGTYDAIAGSGERAEVMRQLERLPLLARAAGTPIDIPKDGAAELGERLALPRGWTVRPLQRLNVEAIGVCHASLVKVTGRGIAEEWTLSAPACGVDDGVRDGRAR